MQILFLERRGNVNQIEAEAVQDELKRSEIENFLSHVARNDEEEEEINGNLRAAEGAEDRYEPSSCV
jgi:hypothetical protein